MNNSTSESEGTSSELFQPSWTLTDSEDHCALTVMSPGSDLSFSVILLQDYSNKSDLVGEVLVIDNSGTPYVGRNGYFNDGIDRFTVKTGRQFVEELRKLLRDGFKEGSSAALPQIPVKMVEEFIAKSRAVIAKRKERALQMRTQSQAAAAVEADVDG